MKKTIVFAILAIFLLSACGSGGQAQVTQPAGEPVPQTGEEGQSPTVVAQPTATTAPTAAPTAEPTAEPAEATEQPTSAAGAGQGAVASDDPAEVIIAAYRKLTEQKAFRVEQTITHPTEGTMVMNVEIMPPTRYRMTSDGFGLIIVDGATYMQASETEWVQTGNMGANLVSAFTWVKSDEEAEVLRGMLQNAEFVAEEELDGETVRHYQYDLNEPTENAFMRNNLWIGADGLPRKLEVIISATAAGDSDQGGVVIIYKDFGASDIVIEAP